MSHHEQHPWEEPDTQQRLDNFLNSDVWNNICDQAEDCSDSLQMMEDISLRVASLVFYLERNILDKASIEEQELLKMINTYEN